MYRLWLKCKDYLLDGFSGFSRRKQINLIKQMMVNPESFASVRQNMLAYLLDFAKHKTSFYSDISYKTLQDFPVINKTTILGQYHNRPIGSSNRPEMSCFPT